MNKANNPECQGCVNHLQLKIKTTRKSESVRKGKKRQLLTEEEYRKARKMVGEGFEAERHVHLPEAHRIDEREMPGADEGFVEGEVVVEEEVSGAALNLSAAHRQLADGFFDDARLQLDVDGGGEIRRQLDAFFTSETD